MKAAQRIVIARTMPDAGERGLPVVEPMGPRRAEAPHLRFTAN